MRIATSTLFDRGLAAIDLAQRNLSRAQQQVSTGHRVNTAADDPVAATQILRTISNLTTNTQYIANQGIASHLLGQTDSTLGQVGELLQSVRTSLVASNNAALSDSDRAAIGVELKSRLDALVSLANSKDGDGHFLFGGYRSDTTPFALTSTGVSYAGDDGARAIQVSATRQIGVSESGADVFGRISTGNGVFTTASSTSNSGSGVIDTGQVTTPASLTGHSYQVQFTVSAGATTYGVVDTTTGTPVPAPAATGNAYTSGSAITFDGLQFTIGGTPANSDRFTVAPAGRQSVFDTLSAAASLLTTPSGGAAGRARVASGALAAIANVDNALNHILNTRASVGARQNELDALGLSANAADIDGQSRLSGLQDTDYAKAIADLTKQQAALSAAQKTFATIGNKTLFDYL